ncbi:MAG: hypothetical protein AAF709_15380 [Pseudomonadota bacterium]
MSDKAEKDELGQKPSVGHNTGAVFDGLSYLKADLLKINVYRLFGVHYSILCVQFQVVFGN